MVCARQWKAPLVHSHLALLEHSTCLQPLRFVLQPLSVDWREKLKANRKATSKSAPSTSSPDSASPSPATASTHPVATADLSMAADGKPNLELLSKGLPAGWRAMWDKNSGDIYYGNVKTRVRIGGKGREQPPCLHIFVGMVLCKMHIFASMTESDVLNSAWCLPRSVSWRTSACAVRYDILS